MKSPEIGTGTESNSQKTLFLSDGEERKGDKIPKRYRESKKRMHANIKEKVAGVMTLTGNKGSLVHEDLPVNPKVPLPIPRSLEHVMEHIPREPEVVSVSSDDDTDDILEMMEGAGYKRKCLQEVKKESHTQ